MTLARVGIAVVATGLVVAVVLIVHGMLGPAPAEEGTGSPTLPLPRQPPSEAADGGDSAAQAPASPAAVLLVHVAGAVTAPGLVHLEEGDRVADAIEAAGGPARHAELDRVNLAAPVADGEQVYVPAEGETPPAPPEAGTGPGEVGAEGSPAVVNVNTAGADELETLPGIGPARAADIIAYRERDGPFQSVEDLLGVPGIGPATLDRLRELVRL